MKIGVITFQLAWNCGAVLQCYALQEYLKSLGHEVAVINYRPQYKEYRYRKYGNPVRNAWKAFRLHGGKRAAKAFVRTILNYRSKSEHIRQWNGFKAFNETYLHLTRVYRRMEELQSDPPVCDVYISGSDQLWNPKLTNGALDEAYFLQFGSEEARRITYAISACELDVPHYGRQIKRLCRRIDALSLREEAGKEELETLLERKIALCPDPTFLVNPDLFTKMIGGKTKPDQDYIVVYVLEDGSGQYGALFSQVEKLKTACKKEVLVLSGPRRWPFPVRQIRGITPEEFLYSINHAFCVVNNSFHATVFSILFQKQFVTMGFQNRNARMTELLKKVGLEDRYCGEGGTMAVILKDPIRYDQVEKRVEELSSEGKKYIRDQLDAALRGKSF